MELLTGVHATVSCKPGQVVLRRALCCGAALCLALTCRGWCRQRVWLRGSCKQQARHLCGAWVTWAWRDSVPAPHPSAPQQQTTACLGLGVLAVVLLLNIQGPQVLIERMDVHVLFLGPAALVCRFYLKGDNAKVQCGSSGNWAPEVRGANVRWCCGRRVCRRALRCCVCLRVRLLKPASLAISLLSGA